MGPTETGRTTRRRVLGGLLALPLAGLAVGVAATARREIATMRPGARGTSATTCAQCGGVDHGMLDPACPAAPGGVSDAGQQAGVPHRGRCRGRGRRRGLPRPRPAAIGKEHDPSLPVDRVVRTTCSPNCTGSCGQLAFVRDERIVKIQQAADYPDEVYSPRGCMKGLSFHLQIYGPNHVQTPLIRTGERGSGEFREATWEEALDHVAAELTRIGETYGYESIHLFGQVPGSGYVHKGANYRPRQRWGCPTGPRPTSMGTCRWACRSRSACRTPSMKPRTGPAAGSC